MSEPGEGFQIVRSKAPVSRTTRGRREGSFDSPIEGWNMVGDDDLNDTNVRKEPLVSTHAPSLFATVCKSEAFFWYLEKL